MRTRPTEFYVEVCLNSIETCPLIEFEDDEDERKKGKGTSRNAQAEPEKGWLDDFVEGLDDFREGLVEFVLDEFVGWLDKFLVDGGLVLGWGIDLPGVVVRVGVWE